MSGAMFPAPASRALTRPLLAGPAQTAAAAAGGFVAGAALLGLVRRRHTRRVALAGARRSRRIGRSGKKRSKSGAPLVDVVATRSLLVDVHLLRAPLRSR